MQVVKQILRLLLQLMFSRRILTATFYFLFTFNCIGQDCTLLIQGTVSDDASDLPLSYVNVYIQETSQGTTSDDKGNFVIDNVCPGEYHFIFSHIGCEPKKIHLDIYRDTTIAIGLSHTPTSLGDVVIVGNKGTLNNQPSLSVSRQIIEDNPNQTLSSLLENETGVHLIKNGNGISKPVVHGLYGNRLTILNNGIAQSGQQWGNDHSPEIDPFASDKIIVLKGASAIEFGGGNLGSVILTEAKRIEQEPHLHGQVNYSYESNGRGHSFNTRFEKFAPSLSWRINGTLKKYGDRKTTSYFLNNTGTKEANIALQLEKSINDKIFIDFYASTFNSELGILRGSHIGNLTDLNQALISETPFFTEEHFSYDIDAPKQNVSHHLAKAKLKYFITDSQLLDVTAAGQLNRRKEFDVRRSGRSDIPSLFLDQTTLNAEVKYSNEFGENSKFKIGTQNILTDNTNNAETGILPLIPDYISWKSGFFSTLSKKKNKTQFNLGLRYDFEHQNVLTISNTTPREIIKYENNFHNLSGLLSLKYDITNTQSISLNTGYTTRNPGINELYSSGLHQGVSGIEEGQINLKAEKALKITLEYKWLPSADFSFNALVYNQSFNDYIFLNPQDEVRLTIRGAFPVFKYEQTDANIFGIDVSTQFTIAHSIIGTLKYSYLKGQDTENNQPLIFMPPNSLSTSFVYRTNTPLSLSESAKIDNIEIELTNRYVFEQKNILAEQDFVSPPPSYNLIALKVSADMIFSGNKLRFFCKVDNLLNTEYRDYLNRQRYFADDLGISIVSGVNYKF